jgi:hypothetical protein
MIEVASGSTRRNEFLAPGLTASPTEAAHQLLALSHTGIGASTGFMEAARGQWTELLRLAGEISVAAVELSALDATELPGLAAFLEDHPTLDFHYVSVHGPAKGWLGDSCMLAEHLARDLPSYVGGVVMHPETLDDPTCFQELGSRLLLENMDPLKHDARTPAELARYFDELPDAGFCFDVAHAYLNDPSMTLAHELLDAFGSQLREVHLSSILDDGTHVPLRTEDVLLFWPVLERCRHVPWILEADLPDQNNP